MSTRPIAFLDVETTGLDSQQHELLEVAIIVREPDPAKADAQVYFSLPIDPEVADEHALRINRYHERREELSKIEVDHLQAGDLLTNSLDGCVVVGNNVGFDLRFIKQLLRADGRSNDEPWYYAPLDLKALVAGRCGMSLPASTACIAEVSGVPIPKGAHAALEDCRWNRDVYDALTGSCR